MQKSKSKVYESLVKFFRVTRWKLILTIVLMIIFFFFLLIRVEQAKMLFYLPIIVSDPFNKYTSGGFDVVIIPTIFSILIALFTYAIQIYIVSCLIISIYNKIWGYLIKPMLKINKLIIVLAITILIGTVSVASLTDNNPSNNVKSITVNVVETRKLNLTFIPIDNPSNFDWKGNDTTEIFLIIIFYVDVNDLDNGVKNDQNLKNFGGVFL